MGTVIKVELTAASINRAIRELKAYEKSLERKCSELCRRLAEIGLTRATADFSAVEYQGDKDVSVDVKSLGKGRYIVVASGTSVLFLEFGAGIKYGSGHEWAEQFGYGPGTWPDKHYRTIHGQTYANWESPDGWYLPKSAGGGKSYGNPPARAMYNADKEIREKILEIAREVFAT